MASDTSPMGGQFDFSETSYTIDPVTGQIFSLARDPQHALNTVDRTIQDLSQALGNKPRFPAEKIRAIISLVNRCKTEMAATSRMSAKIEEVLQKLTALHSKVAKQEKPTEPTKKAPASKPKEKDAEAASAPDSQKKGKTAPKTLRDLPPELIENIARHGTLADAHALLLLQRPINPYQETADATRATAPYRPSLSKAELAAELAKKFWKGALKGKENIVASRFIEKFMNSRTIPFQFPAGFEKAKANVRHLNLTSLPGTIITPEFLTELHRHFPNLQGLRFSGEASVNDTTLRQIVAQWRGLEELYVSNASFGNGIACLAELPKLRSLTLLYYFMRNEDFAVLASCRALEHIDCEVGDEPPILLAGFTSLASLPKLRSLRLRGYDELNDADLACLATCKTIEALRFDNSTQLTPAGIKHLQSLPRLQDLNLGLTSWNNSDVYCAELKELKELRSLALEYVSSITAQGFANITSLPLLQDFAFTRVEEEVHINDTWFACFRNSSQLQSLRLDHSERVTDKGFAYLAHLPELHTLKLNHCPQMTDEGMQHFLPALRGLKTLQLWDCGKITDKGLKCLKALKYLQTLDLYGRPKITGAGLAPIQTLVELRQLILRDCPKIADEALQYLVPCRELQKLNLQGCSITGSGLHHLKSLEKLRNLNLANNKLTFKGLIALSRLTQVTHLNLSGNTLTDDDLLLFRRSTQLQVLYLYECKGLTREGIATLQRLLPNTRILS